LQRRDHVGRFIATRSRRACGALALGVGAVDAQLLALKSASCEAAARHVAHVGGRDRAAADDALAVTMSATLLARSWLASTRLAWRGLEQKREAQDAHARIDAGVEVAGVTRPSMVPNCMPWMMADCDPSVLRGKSAPRCAVGFGLDDRFQRLGVVVLGVSAAATPIFK